MKNSQYIRQAGDGPVHPPKQDRAGEHISNSRLIEIFEGREGPDCDPLAEIRNLVVTITPDHDTGFLEQVHSDITLIFQGKYKNYRYSTTKYHDLRHTRNVTLAAIRLLHGLFMEKTILPPEIMELCVVCAYFHDTGMLLTDEDTEQFGSAYLKSHEERSISFLRNYLADNNMFGHYIDVIPSIINCTNLTIQPEELDFNSPELRLTGWVLGTADIMAQMADRYYLESLPLLYQEQLDAGIELHTSSLELMRRTTQFFHEVIEYRLHSSFNNIGAAMQTHFREWWGLDRNLYMEQIEKNIKYLEFVVQKHDSGEGELYNYLRRKQPPIK